jgi:MSHA pilin protein MshC
MTRHVLGFTITELVVTLILVGILAAVALPRMFDRKSFDAMRYFDQALAGVRYAQKVAIAQNKTSGIFVIVNSSDIRVCQSSAFVAGTPTACALPLTDPTTNAAMTIAAPSGVSIAASASSFSFNALGQPSTGPVTVTVSATGEPTRSFTVEKETGYVHP